MMILGLLWSPVFICFSVLCLAAGLEPRRLHLSAICLHTVMMTVNTYTWETFR